MFLPFLFGLLLAVLPGGHAKAAAPAPVVTPAPIVIAAPTSTPDIIKAAAIKYGVNYSRLYSTLSCESMGFRNAGQSRIPHKGGPGGYEDSWGVAQIHLPAHPDITKEQALDRVWAINWAARQFAAGNAWMWTCYNDLYA